MVSQSFSHTSLFIISLLWAEDKDQPRPSQESMQATEERVGSNPRSGSVATLTQAVLIQKAASTQPP